MIQDQIHCNQNNKDQSNMTKQITQFFLLYYFAMTTMFFQNGNEVKEREGKCYGPSFIAC